MGEQHRHRPEILDENDQRDIATLTELRADPRVEFLDLRELLRAESAQLLAEDAVVDTPESERWIHYPWRRLVVGLPGASAFRAIRLDRNRNKLTGAEQERLRAATIGVVGQSVGHSVAYALAMEGVCGRLRLADLDEIELSNLNRVPGTVLDVGQNKAVVTARRIAELDPYLPVEIFSAGVDENSVHEFLDGLSIVVEECDSLDIKLVLREAAAEHRIPLLMETSDRGLLDVERFDLEPDRPPFHGLLGGIRSADLRGLTAREKAPFVVRIFGADGLSARMAASMVEVGETVSSWPQLGSDVMLGAASVVAAVRRIGGGLPLASGRIRIDVDQHLDELVDPVVEPEPVWAATEDESAAASPIGRVLESARRAPSGGNTQPWSVRVVSDAPAVGDSAVQFELAPDYAAGLDVGFRGSAVAFGAAVHNARVTAAAHGVLGAHEFTDGAGAAGLTATLRLGTGADPDLAADYPHVLRRETNRQLGTGKPLAADVLAALTSVAEAEGARLHAVTAMDDLARAASLLGESDRVRYLTPRLHAEMLAEVRWPDDADQDTGIDARSLELTAAESAAYRIGARTDVMSLLRAWSAGAALGKYTGDRVRSSSAIVAITFPVLTNCELSRYARAGAAVQRVWIQAEQRGLAVQPISPVFLYARTRGELTAISPDFADTLASLQGGLLELLGVPEHETMALVLRLSYAAAATVRSRRRPVSHAGTSS
ncbi:Rv1355c family protein [Nocardia callitridis]|uniref:Rv1355c family protein n=1 Tax=Nocardia callitridis TaxID=648753 RepID=A0ABP9JSL9_9NOCA